MRILPNRNEVGVFLRNPRTLETNFKTLGEASKDSINGCTVRVIMQIKGKLERSIGVVGDSLQRYSIAASGGMA